MEKRRIEVREAQSSDTDALNALALLCPAPSGIPYAYVRDQNYLEWNRHLGEQVKTWLAIDPEKGDLHGTISVSLHHTYLRGKDYEAGYMSDFKVNPKFRGSGAGDLLMRKMMEQLDVWGSEFGKPIPLLSAIMMNNENMRLRKLPDYQKKGIVDFKLSHQFQYFLCPVKGKPLPEGRYRVEFARESDLKEMHDFWLKHQSTRSLGRRLSLDEWKSWMKTTPGVSIADFCLLRNSEGKLLGFTGVWDQSKLRKSVVLDLPPVYKVLRPLWNLIAPVVELPRLPAPGETFSVMSTVFFCLEKEDPEMWDALYRGAMGIAKCHFGKILVFGLDARSPLTSFVKSKSMDATKVGLYWDARGIGEEFHFEGSETQVESAFG